MQLQDFNHGSTEIYFYNEKQKMLFDWSVAMQLTRTLFQATPSKYFKQMKSEVTFIMIASKAIMSAFKANSTRIDYVWV